MKSMLICLVFVALVGSVLWAFEHRQASWRFDKESLVTGEPVVTDRASGLMWQGCTQGLSGEHCETGNPIIFSWAQAKDYCAQTLNEIGWSGFKDWRLPNPKELASIVDDGRIDPCVDTTVFPNTPSASFWTSTPYGQGSMPEAWRVNFEGGPVSHAEQDIGYHVRCVRKAR